jgi:hypothetical protein
MSTVSLCDSMALSRQQVLVQDQTSVKIPSTITRLLLEELRFFFYSRRKSSSFNSESSFCILTFGLPYSCEATRARLQRYQWGLKPPCLLQTCSDSDTPHFTAELTVAGAANRLANDLSPLRWCCVVKVTGSGNGLAILAGCWVHGGLKVMGLHPSAQPRYGKSAIRPMARANPKDSASGQCILARFVFRGD